MAEQAMICGDCGWSGTTAEWRSNCKGFPCQLGPNSAPLSPRGTQTMTTDERLAAELEKIAKIERVVGSAVALPESRIKIIEEAAAALRARTASSTMEGL